MPICSLNQTLHRLARDDGNLTDKLTELVPISHVVRKAVFKLHRWLYSHSDPSWTPNLDWLNNFTGPQPEAHYMSLLSVRILPHTLVHTRNLSIFLGRGGREEKDSGIFVGYEYAGRRMTTEAASSSDLNSLNDRSQNILQDQNSNSLA